MASWFDSLAKKSSQRAADEDSGTRRGLSRRQVIVGGSAAAAAAWTAPMLMASPAYAYGVSGCPAGNTICGNANELQACCPPGQQCTRTQNANGTFTNGCAPAGTPGGTCTNNGEGTSGCNNTVFCNGNSSSDSCRCQKPLVCGGYGAQCTTSGTNPKGCQPGYVCYNDAYCTPACSATNPCPTNLATGGSLVCVSGVCKQACQNKNDCPQGSNGRTCTSGFCA